jgi:prolyl-tRNA editing enzyme YbaK/EbsC (Cys-tRNA(Pro) deacylase)
LSAPTRPLSEAARRVQAELHARGFANPVVEFEVAIKTAAAAAEAVGCDVAQIVKSLVLRRLPDGGALLVAASGANRVDLAKVAALAGAPVAMADAKRVREATGFAIGGVAPLAHPAPLETLIDRDLTRHARIWAAAGHPNSMFELTPDELVRLTGGRVVEVA